MKKLLLLALITGCLNETPRDVIGPTQSSIICDPINQDVWVCSDEHELDYVWICENTHGRWSCLQKIAALNGRNKHH